MEYLTWQSTTVAILIVASLYAVIRLGYLIESFIDGKGFWKEVAKASRLTLTKRFSTEISTFVPNISNDGRADIPVQFDPISESKSTIDKLKTQLDDEKVKAKLLTEHAANETASLKKDYDIRIESIKRSHQLELQENVKNAKQLQAELERKLKNANDELTALQISHVNEINNLQKKMVAGAEQKLSIANVEFEAKLVAMRDNHEKEKSQLEARMRDNHEKEKSQLEARMRDNHEKEKSQLEARMRDNHEKEKSQLEARMRDNHEKEKSQLEARMRDNHEKEKSQLEARMRDNYEKEKSQLEKEKCRLEREKCELEKAKSELERRILEVEQEKEQLIDLYKSSNELQRTEHASILSQKDECVRELNRTIESHSARIKTLEREKRELLDSPSKK